MIIFLEKTKSQTLANRTVFLLEKPDSPESQTRWYFFATTSLGLNLFYLGPLMPCFPFPCLKYTLIFKFPSLASFDSIMKLPTQTA
jgi:hypothetical protein